MEIINLASSSAGNCYIIKEQGRCFMIEAGISVGLIRSRLFKARIALNQIEGVAVSHSHGDHACSAKWMSQFANIYMSADNDLMLDNRFPMTEWQRYKVSDTFGIIGFPLPHDCKGTFGFLIDCKGKLILFVPDTPYLPFRFNMPIDTIMIECNYNEEVIDRMDARTKRTAQSHMSLFATIKALEGINKDKTETIYLMHLSDGNSDQRKMIDAVQRKFGIPTYACLKEGGFSE